MRDLSLSLVYKGSRTFIGLTDGRIPQCCTRGHIPSSGFHTVVQDVSSVSLFFGVNAVGNCS